MGNVILVSMDNRQRSLIASLQNFPELADFARAADMTVEELAHAVIAQWVLERRKLQNRTSATEATRLVTDASPDVSLHPTGSGPVVDGGKESMALPASRRSPMCIGARVGQFSAVEINTAILSRYEKIISALPTLPQWAALAYACWDVASLINRKETRDPDPTGLLAAVEEGSRVYCF
jgi:hypothetical protein